jgi:transposase
MTYSIEFRIAVADDYDQTGSSIETAATFHCSESWVRRLIQRRRDTGSLEPRPAKRPNNNKLDERDLEELAALIARRPDMTLAELAAALDGKVSVPTVWRATQALGLPLKKRPCTPPSRTGPTSPRRGVTGSRTSRTCGSTSSCSSTSSAPRRT